MYYYNVPRPSVTAFYGYAWRLLGQHGFALFGISLMAFVITAVIAVLIEQIPNEAATGVFNLASFLLIEVPVQWSVGLLYIYVARGREPDAIILVKPYGRQLLPLLISVLLYFVIIAIGFTLLVIPGLILSVRLSFAPYLVLDEGMGPIQALQESFTRTSGRFWLLVGTGMMAIPIMLGGMLLLLIGLVPAILWVTLASAVAYQSITNAYLEAQFID